MSSIYTKYGEYYDLVYYRKNYEQECKDIVEYFDKFLKFKPIRILDVGCGTGGHSLILAKMGYEVTGIDLSKVMISQAIRKAEEFNLNVNFHVQDMRNIQLDGKFDVAICLFGTFDYLITDEDISRALSSIRRHLVKNGIFIFDFWPSYYYAQRPRWHTTRKCTPRENIIILRVINGRFNVVNSIITLDLECYVIENNELKDHFHEYHVLRAFTINELKHFLIENNFTPKAFYKLSWTSDKIYGSKEVDAQTSNAVCIAMAT
ncbi:MAG: class I SAM-dependent methyltransferase [archaeon GB-1867-035]|nr:class I SAM-dependent methyltransferase [Candidatus Culexmicrobium profundum]